MATREDLTKQVTARMIDQIQTRLREAHLVSANAKSFSAEGLDDRSIETLLEIEPLIYEAKALLEAVTIIRRDNSVR